LLADVGAIGVTRVAAGDERLARLEHERLDLVPRNAEDLADLLVRQGIELGEYESRSLVVREPPHVDDQVPEILPQLHLRRQTLGQRLREFTRRLLAPRPEDRETAIACDREQPRAQVNRLLGAHEIVVCSEKRLLDGVLGFLRVAEHVPAERQDRAMMSVICGLERRSASLTNQRHEVGVRCQAEEPQRGKPRHPCRRRARYRTRFHEWIICKSLLKTQSKTR
jgi:hypothetical protein